MPRSTQCDSAREGRSGGGTCQWKGGETEEAPGVILLFVLFCGGHFLFVVASIRS